MISGPGSSDVTWNAVTFRLQLGFYLYRSRTILNRQVLIEGQAGNEQTRNNLLHASWPMYPHRSASFKRGRPHHTNHSLVSLISPSCVNVIREGWASVPGFGVEILSECHQPF